MLISGVQKFTHAKDKQNPLVFEADLALIKPLIILV